MRTKVALVVSAFLLAGLVACAKDEAPEGLFFPTFEWSEGDEFPLAGIWDVTLVERSGCLFVQRPDGQLLLPLWPDGYRAVRRSGGIHLLDEGDNVVATPGTRVDFGGGYGGLRWAQATIGDNIPERCQLPRDSYVLVAPYS